MFRLFQTLLFTGSWLLASCSWAIDLPKVRVLFNHPVCATYVYETPVYPYRLLANELTPEQVSPIVSKTPGIYCRLADFSTDKIKSAPVFKTITEQFVRPGLTQVDAAFFLFESLPFAEAICTAHVAQPFTMTLTLQKGARSDAVRRLEQCMGKSLRVTEIGCDWLTAEQRCPVNQVSSMHAKLIKFRYDDAHRTYVFGSGNANYSLYSTRDVWVLAEATAADAGAPLVKQLDCQFMVLQDSRWATGIHPTAWADAYSDCLGGTPSYDVTKQFAAFLLPLRWLPGRREPILDEVIPKLTASSTTIFLTSQDLGGRKIPAALEAFLQRGGKLRILLDDDWFYTRFFGEDLGMASFDFATGWLESMSEKYPDRLEIRYLETDNTANFQTSLHHKFMVFETASGPAVLFGSPNIKDGALLRNIESLFLVRDPTIVAAFVAEVTYLWAHARSENDMPMLDSNLFVKGEVPP